MENTEKTFDNSIDKIEGWKNLAAKAQFAQANATASRDEKQSTFNALAWLSMTILIDNKVQDKVALAKAVSKEGQFFSLRQCVSNAKPLATQAIEKGTVTVFEGRGKKRTEKTFTMQEIKDAEKPLFSVGVAYKATLTKETEVTSEFTDKEAIALYSEKEGISVKDIESMGLTQEAITQGHAMHVDAIRQQLAENVPALSADIEGKFNALLSIDKNVAYTLVKTLSDIPAIQEMMKAEYDKGAFNTPQVIAA